MGAISPAIALLVALSAAAQVLGIYLMPLTKGLTAPLPTIGTAIAFLVGIGLMARIANMGVNLSLLVPVLAATVPLGAIAVSVLAYGEAASLAKIGTLAAACILIGVANLI